MIKNGKKIVFFFYLLYIAYNQLRLMSNAHQYLNNFCKLNGIMTKFCVIAYIQ